MLMWEGKKEGFFKAPGSISKAGRELRLMQVFCRGEQCELGAHQQHRDGTV